MAGYGQHLRIVATLCVATALAVPAVARPGFGVKGDGGSGRSSSSGATVERPRSDSSRNSGSASSGSARSGDSRGGSSTYRRDDGGRRPGFGQNPNSRDGGPREGRGSRDRYFDRRGNDGGYGYFDGGRRRDRRDWRDYHSPFYYFGTPYFAPFGYGYGTDSVFGYYDAYLYPERRYDDRREIDRDEETWPARQSGNVKLDIVPRNVEVPIDGVLTTRDGQAVLDLPEGNYKLEVTGSGYLPWSTELVVRQGLRFRVERRLERDANAPREPMPRLVGELLLDVTPDDAIAELDDRLLGVVNLLRGGTALRTIPVGTHTLRLSRPGYRPVTREITLEAREPLRLSVTMERE